MALGKAGHCIQTSTRVSCVYNSQMEQLYNSRYFYSYNLWHQVTRKDSLRRLTNIHCETIRNERLAEYRAALEAEQPGFLEEKIKTLEFIRREQQECGVPVTIEQKEIDDTKAQLAELLKQREIANEVE